LACRAQESCFKDHWVCGLVSWMWFVTGPTREGYKWYIAPGPVGAGAREDESTHFCNEAQNY